MSRPSIGSSAHLSVPCLRCCCPVSCCHSPFFAPFLSPLPSCLPDFCRLCSCGSAKISFSVSLYWSSTDICHHGACLLPPSLYHVSHTQTSNMRRRSTHCAAVTWRLSIYFHTSLVPAAFRKIWDPFYRQVPSCHFLDRFPVPFHKKYVWTHAIRFSVAADKTHVSASGRSTACTTAL